MNLLNLCFSISEKETFRIHYLVIGYSEAKMDMILKRKSLISLYINDNGTDKAVIERVDTMVKDF